MASLLLGPVLRYVGERDAVVWVEVDEPCTVQVLDHRVRTFRVGARHYALVVVGDLAPGSCIPYEVALDGVVHWPPAGEAPSLIRTRSGERALRLVMGSCRALGPDRGPDALAALAGRLRAQPVEQWPDALLLLGDQIYADELSPQMLSFIRERRGAQTGPPIDEVSDLEEYARLYGESWRQASVRWLLSNLSTSMLWDDHDVRNDWNISRSWREQTRSEPWWQERAVGAIVSYWLYQHLGNLDPEQLAADELYAQVCAAEDAEPLLRAWASRIHTEGAGARWSYRRDFGRVRFLAIDCRAGRVLGPGHRSLLDEQEWRWLHSQVRGDIDHLLLGLSVPWLITEGIDRVEAWNETVCDGAWGARAARAGERLRRLLSLDHWPAFNASFDRLSALVHVVGAGREGPPPSAVLALSGEVHHGYLARARYPASMGVSSRVYQVTCSPFRNPLGPGQRFAQRFMCTPLAGLVGRALAASVGVRRPRMRWRYEEGIFFDNQLATLEFDGRRARVRFERATAGGGLAPLAERQLA